MMHLTQFAAQRRPGFSEGRRALRASLLLAALPLTGACAALVGIEETEVKNDTQGSTAAVCGDGEVQEGEECDDGATENALGGATSGTGFCTSECTWQPGHDFSCLDETSSDDESDVVLSFSITDLNTMEPIEGAKISVCGSFDHECDLPEREVTSDADGFASTEVPSPFSGSVLISADGFVHLRKFRAQAIYSDATISAEMLVIPLFEGLAGGIAGGPPDPTLGHMTVEVQDCDGVPSPNFSVSVSSPDGGAFAYLDPGGFNTELSETTPTGRWAGINLPTGRQDVTAERSDGTSIPGVVQVQAAVAGDDDPIAVVSNLLLAPNHVAQKTATETTDE